MSTYLKKAVTRQVLRQGEQGGVIGHIAACKDKCSLLLVQTSQLGFQVFMHQTISGYVARTSRASAKFLNSVPTDTNKSLKVGM